MCIGAKSAIGRTSSGLLFIYLAWEKRVISKMVTSITEYRNVAELTVTHSLKSVRVWSVSAPFRRKTETLPTRLLFLLRGNQDGSRRYGIPWVSGFPTRARRRAPALAKTRFYCNAENA